MIIALVAYLVVVVYALMVGVVAVVLNEYYYRLRLPKSSSIIEGGLCTTLALTWPISVPLLAIRWWNR